MADALSRREGESQEAICSAMISFPTPLWIEELKNSYQESTELVELHKNLLSNQDIPKGFFLQQCLIMNKGRLVLAPDLDFKKKYYNRSILIPKLVTQGI